MSSSISFWGVNPASTCWLGWTAHRKCSVLVLSMLPESLNVELLLHKGAKGYVMKSEPPDRILEALRKVSGGGVYLSPAMQKKLATNKGDRIHE